MDGKGIKRMKMEVECFRAGDYGSKGVWREDDISQLAQDYNPEKHEAPVTIDHAQAGPAFGWVKRLIARGKVLIAELGDLNEQFRESVKRGEYRKVSVEIYRKFGNDERPYLRALSFLGAQVPHVKGLAGVHFEEQGEYDVVECGSGNDGNVPISYNDGGEQRMDELERLKKDLEEARNRLAQFSEGDMAKAVANLESRVQAAEAQASEERQLRMAAEDRARATAAHFGERNKADVRKAAEQHIAQFCETALKEGYITPAQMGCGLRELLIDLALAPAEKVIAFGEDGKMQGSPIELMKGILTQHKVVLFGEVAPTGERGLLGNIAEFSEKARKAGVTMAQYQKAIEAVKNTDHTPELYIQANPDEFR